MASSSLRRASGIAALATVVGLAVVPSVQAQTMRAQTALAPAATSLSIRVVDTRIEPGDTGRVNGHLAIAGDVSAEGRTVTLEARALGSTGFVPVAEATAATQGGISADVLPQVTTRYRWRYAGDEDTRRQPQRHRDDPRRRQTHVPHRLATSLSIRAVHRETPSGIQDLVRGSLRVRHVGLGHRPVILLARAAGSEDWTFEGTQLTERHGVVKFPVDPAEDSAYRLAFLGTARLQPAHSGVVRLAARPDVSITAAPAAIMLGESTTVSGVVTSQGAGLAGVTVELWGTKVGRPHSTGKIATATTADDGSVSFTDSPRRSTKYRLRVAHTAGLPNALSAVALVVVDRTPAA